MNHDSIRLRVTVESMREQLLQHFADYENVILESIKNAVTPENITSEFSARLRARSRGKSGWHSTRWCQEQLKTRSSRLASSTRLLNSMSKACEQRKKAK